MREQQPGRQVCAILIPAVLAAALLGWQRSALAEPPAAHSRDTVRMIVDYGDDVQVHFNSLPWKEGMTAIDALEAVGKLPHGVSSHHRGSGTTALVTQIGDLKNTRPAKEGHNSTWMFWINKSLSEVGAGSCPLHPNDVIVWKFTTPDPTETP